MSVGVAYTCQILGQKESDPTFASIVFSTESVFSAIGGALLLNEIMSGRGYFGCVLIFIGIVLSQLNGEKIVKKPKNQM
jgi:drug/metabolite transporter (DMT)-like permease